LLYYNIQVKTLSQLSAEQSTIPLKTDFFFILFGVKQPNQNEKKHSKITTGD